MKGFGCIISLALVVAVGGCAAALRNAAPSPDRPGTRITVSNPNPAKWLQGRVVGPQRQTDARLYVCRPLACAGASAVSIQILVSPARHPDPAALEKAAKLLPTQFKAQDMMMEAASEGDERISPLGSRVTEARGYPAIIAEAKRTSRGKASFIVRGDLFIGAALVKIASQSTTREAAKRYFDEFVAILAIIDVEAPLPSTASSEPLAAADRSSERPADSVGSGQ